MDFSNNKGVQASSSESLQTNNSSLFHTNQTNPIHSANNPFSCDATKNDLFDNSKTSNPDISTKSDFLEKESAFNNKNTFIVGSTELIIGAIALLACIIISFFDTIPVYFSTTMLAIGSIGMIDGFRRLIVTNC